MAMAELSLDDMKRVLAKGESAFVVEILETLGSTPRDFGARMLVCAQDIFGTIGGGSAEWVAVQSARDFIAGAPAKTGERITLGPEIDQCCGGTIDVSYRLLTPEVYADCQHGFNIASPTKALIFGAGHTGIALANALLPLGFEIEIIDSRSEFCKNESNYEINCLALPEQAVRNAQKGSIFIVTTHDHSLDFLITAEALERNDAKYVGMIGSQTKRSVLKGWMKENGYDPRSSDPLFCPIGGTGIRSKQPEFIAAMCIAEILLTLEQAKT